jgi:hypothetical protein
MQFVQQLTDNFVVAAVALVPLGLGWFSINYLSKRRKMLHQERMASLVKGLHYAGVGKEIFTPPKPKIHVARDHVKRGLGWLFGGAGLSTALYGYTAMQPHVDAMAPMQASLAGIIPGVIGLAHLLFSFLCRSKQTPVIPGLPIRSKYPTSYPSYPKPVLASYPKPTFTPRKVYR